MVNLLFEKKDANNLEWINTKEDVRNKTCLIKNVSTDFYSPVDNVFSPYQTLKDGGQDVKFLYLDDVEDPTNLNLILSGTALVIKLFNLVLSINISSK